MVPISASQYREAVGRPKRKNKFGAQKTVVDGITFASKAEAARYVDLKILERAGEIEALILQPRYPLVVDGQKIADYVADFEYVLVKTGESVTEDTKGVQTRDFKLKAKLFKALYGREVVLS